VETFLIREIVLIRKRTSIRKKRDMPEVYDMRFGILAWLLGALTPRLFSVGEICLCKKLQSPVGCRPGTGTGALLISTGHH
jgi:hypothetical protein